MKTLLILSVLLLGACGKLGSTDAKLDPASPAFEEMSLFVSAARERGIEIEGIAAAIPLKFSTLEKPFLAKCDRPLIGQRTITIDLDAWKDRTADYRKSILLHELGHCVLNQGHREAYDEHGVPLSLMNPTVPDGNEFRQHEKEYLDELFLTKN